MDPTNIGLIGLILLIVFLFIRMPVGFVMALLGFVGFAAVTSWDAAMRTLAKEFYNIFSSYSLTVVPLFILMGQVTYHAGISRKLYESAYKFLGHMRGGLAMATVGASAGFAAICGSTNASTATMATVALPEMKRYKYDLKMATGTVAAGGSLGILIPPSVIFIVYGIATKQSIGELFIAGILPGFILALLFVLTIYVWSYISPNAAPVRASGSTLKDKLLSLTEVWETVFLFLLVIGGLYLGFFTPTEAGAIGAGGSIVLAFLRRRLTWRYLYQTLTETTRISCMILVIVAGASVFARFLAITRLPFFLANWVTQLPLPPYGIMIFIIFIYFLGGCFIDPLALILLTIPIFFPVVTSLGFDPIWFGVVIVLVSQIGAITPPVGINVYVVKGVAADTSLGIIFKGVAPFLISLFITALILIPFPEIVLFLPNLMK